MTPQKVWGYSVSWHVFHRNEIKINISPDVPKNESGLIQMIRMGKSKRHKWVKRGSLDLITRREVQKSNTAITDRLTNCCMACIKCAVNKPYVHTVYVLLQSVN